MSDSAKKEDKNTEIPSQTFNTQLNFLMENELNAIGKLPKDLADRIVAMLENLQSIKKITTIKYQIQRIKILTLLPKIIDSIKNKSKK